MIKKTIFLVIACILVLKVKAQTEIPQFKEGERVVFVGNSITHGGPYHSYVWLYYMTHFTNMPIFIMNGGIGGDCAWDIESRLEEDVFSKNPSYITLTFGMNDVGYDDFFKDNAQEIAEKQIEKSYDSYKRIEKRLKAEVGVTKVLIGGSPYDETSKIENQVFPTKNNALLKINEFQKAAAEENGWGFVDFNRPMLKILQKEQAKDSLFSFSVGDRIHPDNSGHMVMAYLFLKGQGLEGKKVAEVEINAKKEVVLKSENCFVANVERREGNIAFYYLAKSLPYPMDSIPRGWENKHAQKEALNLVPFMEEFNQEILKVQALHKGTYYLQIDGKPIKEFSSEQLANGVNLAKLENTPQYEQALKIMILNEERFEIEKRFRDYALMEFSILKKAGVPLFEDGQAAVDTIRAHWDNVYVRGYFGVFEKAKIPEMKQLWNKQMDDIVETIYSMNKPVEHKVELIKIN